MAGALNKNWLRRRWLYADGTNGGAGCGVAFVTGDAGVPVATDRLPLASDYYVALERFVCVCVCVRVCEIVKRMKLQNIAPCNGNPLLLVIYAHTYALVSVLISIS